MQSIFAHKLRTFIILIGIIIGVVSVVTVGASISGFNTYVVTAVTKAPGVNHLMIVRFAFQGRRTPERWARAMSRTKRPYIENYEWLRYHSKSCLEVGAQDGASVNLKHDGREAFFTQAAGVTANMADVEDKYVAEDRFIVPHEVGHAALVCVIGAEVKEKLFEGRDPIGQTLKIQGTPMTVIGVEEKRGTFMGQSLDNHLYIPLTAFGHIFGRRQSLQIHGKASGVETVPSTIEEARMVMRNRHKLIGEEEDTFGIVNTGDLRGQICQFTGAIALVVTPIALLSLLVGGIVVMNIMLISVTEQTFEIRLRKAVGARADRHWFNS